MNIIEAIRSQDYTEALRLAHGSPSAKMVCEEELSLAFPGSLCSVESEKAKNLTALHHACLLNPGEPYLGGVKTILQLIETLLSSGADINAGSRDSFAGYFALAAREKHPAARCDRRGKTPLHLAAEWGAQDAARLLIQRGADINSHDESGSCPLADALSKGRHAIADMLLDAGADAQFRDFAGQTALHLAVNGNAPASLLEKVLAKAPDFIDTPDGVEHYPILEAAKRGSVEMVDTLLKGGARKDVSNPNDGNLTLMDCAIKSKNTNLIQMLAANGIVERVGRQAHWIIMEDIFGKEAVERFKHSQGITDEPQETLFDKLLPELEDDSGDKNDESL